MPSYLELVPWSCKTYPVVQGGQLSLEREHGLFLDVLVVGRINGDGRPLLLPLAKSHGNVSKAPPPTFKKNYFKIPLDLVVKVILSHFTQLPVRLTTVQLSKPRNRSSRHGAVVNESD